MCLLTPVSACCNYLLSLDFNGLIDTGEDVAPPLLYYSVKRDARDLGGIGMTTRFILCSTALWAALAGVAGAQQSQPQVPDTVPKGYRPPPGMCRIWLEKVPAQQQPAPTDCRTAVHDKPTNGKVIFGDDYVDKGRKSDDRDLPLVRKFGEDKKRP